jgi:hypothetical protein
MKVLYNLQLNTFLNSLLGRKLFLMKTENVTYKINFSESFTRDFFPQDEKYAKSSIIIRMH